MLPHNTYIKIIFGQRQIHALGYVLSLTHATFHVSNTSLIMNHLGTSCTDDVTNTCIWHSHFQKNSFINSTGHSDQIKDEIQDEIEHVAHKRNK